MQTLYLRGTHQCKMIIALLAEAQIEHMWLVAHSFRFPGDKGCVRREGGGGGRLFAIRTSFLCHEPMIALLQVPSFALSPRDLCHGPFPCACKSRAKTLITRITFKNPMSTKASPDQRVEVTAPKQKKARHGKALNLPKLCTCFVGSRFVELPEWETY